MNSKQTQSVIMPAFVTTNVCDGTARYQYHGRMSLRVATAFIAKAFLAAGKDDFELTQELVIIAKNTRGKHWIANAARINDRDLAQIFQDDAQREKLWETDMLVRSEELRVYNPWQEKPERRRLPLAIIRYHLGRDSVLASLDATENELVAVLREIVETHIYGIKEPAEVEKFLHTVSMRKIISEKEARTKPPEEEPRKSRSQLAPEEELKNYLIREMRMRGR